jgi:hypothetical protein
MRGPILPAAEGIARQAAIRLITVAQQSCDADQPCEEKWTSAPRI